MASPTWSSTEQVARPATKRFHPSDWRTLEACCQPCHPRHCCMSHSDELPSANGLSALQHHLSGTLSLSPFRTVTRLYYLNLDLKHIVLLRLCFLTVLFASASEATVTWRRFTNFVLYCIVWTWWCNDATALASYATTTMMMMS